MLLTMWIADDASMPREIQAIRPIIQPVARIVSLPVRLYGCMAMKMRACSTTAITGMRNQPPKVCMSSPRNMYSSAMHCSGPITVSSRKVAMVNWLFNGP